MSALSVPEVADLDPLAAALAYAKAGWYVGPVARGTKHPGSVLGDRWQIATSRDPQVLAAWFAGTDAGVFLHCGRSGALVFDVDTPERLHPLIAQAVAEVSPPWQNTRPAEPARRHYVFAQPPHRLLGNSLGNLRGGWGEIRGRNGVIVVAPTVHPEPSGGYAWGRVGTVPELPGYLLAELPDALDAADAATDAQVTAFLAKHTAASRPGLLEVHVRAFTNKTEAGESRHDTMTGHLAGAMKEAAAGFYRADLAADTLQSVFEAAVKAHGRGRQGAARTPAEARSEWRGLLAWAVAQAEAADLEAVRARVAEKVPERPPGVQNWTPEQDGSPAPHGAPETPQGDDAEEGPAPGASWQPLDLADVVAGLLAGTITRHAPTIGRRTDDACLFYPGKVNGIAGPSGCGKTWTALLACAQTIAAGQVAVYIDLEDDEAGVVGRLLDLGADPADVLARFRYVRPDESYGLAARAGLEELVRTSGAALVVVDSTGESMALDGAKPNDDDDTARWFRRLPTALARLGPAVVVLDHVVKADDGGLWPIGSQRKRAAVNGAQYMQGTLRPFTKGEPGAAKLVCAKDRHGNYKAGEKVAELHVTPAGDGLAAELLPPTTQGAAVAETFRPTGYMEKISRALEAAAEPVSLRGVQDLVPGKQAYVRQALALLVAEGYVVRSAGARNSTLHESVRPFREPVEGRDTLEAETVSETVSSVSVSLEGDTGHTLPTVSGTQSGHSRDTLTDPPVEPPTSAVPGLPEAPLLVRPDPAGTWPCPDCGGVTIPGHLKRCDACSRRHVATLTGRTTA